MSSLFSTSTTLPASAETMFAFHSDPHNLHHVMPPTLRVTDLITEVPAREGGRIEIRCRDWGLIPMHWVCRWKAVEPPHLLMDEMLQGPFRLFVHEHRFQPLENGTCLMQDHITYQWGSSWWGKLVSETFVRLYLIVLFRYRHHRTRQWALCQAKERAL
jgi:ligand-binding SRPBCC domain-containing protein